MKRKWKIKQSDARYNGSPPTDWYQTLSPNPDWPFRSTPLLYLWTWLCMVWNKPLAFQVFCPRSASCCFFVHLLAGKAWDTKIFFDLGKALLSNNLNISVSWMLFSYRIQNTALCQLMRLTLSQPKPRWG